MALPNLGTSKVYDAYSNGIGNIKDSILQRISPTTFKGKVKGAVSGAFESEFPGILSVLAGFQGGGGNSGRPPVSNDNDGEGGSRVNLTPLLVAILGIKQDTQQIPMMLNVITKILGNIHAELEVLNDLTLRSTNLNKGNIMMMRSAAKNRAAEYRDNEFEEQIAASRFQRVQEDDEGKGTKPVEPKKEDDGIFGKLKGFMAALFTPFKTFFGFLAPIARGLAPILKLVARIGLVDLPLLGLLAVGAKGLFGGIKKWYNGHQNGDRGLDGLNNFTSGINETFEAMTEPMKKALTNYLMDHKDFFLPLIKFFSNVFSIIIEPFKAVYKLFGEDDLMTILKDSWKNIKEQFVSALNIIGALGDGWVKENITEPAANALSGLLIAAKDKILDIMNMIVDSVVGFFTEIKDSITNYITDTYQNLKDSVKTTASNLVPETIKNFFEDNKAPAEPPKSGLQKALQPNSKEAKTAAKMILNQQYVSNYNYSKDAAQVAASNIIAPVTTTNVKTNNFTAAGSSVRNPNAQTIINGNVSQ